MEHDQLGTVTKAMGEIQQEIAHLRREVSEVVARSFKWTIVILAFAAVVTWFGVFMIVRAGGLKLLLPK